MEPLKSLPDEFFQPLLPCFGLLKNCNILFFDVRPLFWRILPYFYLLPSVVAYHAALTIYLMEGLKSGTMGLDELVYVVPVYVVCVQTTFKAAIVVSNKKNIKSLILRLGNLWRTVDLSEVQISKKNVLLKRLNFCYAVFYWTNILGSWHYILAPLLEIIIRRYILQQDFDLVLPFKCYFPFNPISSWVVYLATYFFEAYSMITVVYCYLGSEFLLIILCSHLVTEFTLLQEDLLHIKPRNQNISHGNEPRECSSNFDIYGNEKTDLKDLIRRHQILIGLTQDLDDIFNLMTFVNLSAATISICFFGFAAKVSQGNAVLVLNSFIAVIASIMPIFNLCYYAEMLKDASEGIARAAYSNLWYKGNKSYVSSICFILKRSQIPCCLTSLKYNPISLNTFTTVMSTTWSYFSLASSLYDEGAEN